MTNPIGVALAAFGLCGAWGTRAGADVLSAASFVPMTTLTLQQPESIYAPPEVMPEGQRINAGSVHFNFQFAYFTDFVYRGVELLEPPGGEDRLNLQMAGKAQFDLGNKVPHPFVSVFVNVADSDPVSNFQAVWPTVGFDWTIRPFKLSAGNVTYIFPDRDTPDAPATSTAEVRQTSEVFARLEVDDGYFLNREKPILSPYVYAAYDYDTYNGYYVEAGVKHDFEFEGTGFVLTTEANVAYISGLQQFYVDPNGRVNSGFQHYQFGAIGQYSLNTLLNIPQRLGEWDLVGYAYFTDSLDEGLRANTQLWGGVGVTFSY
jgi:hypothetical protein